MRRDGAEEGLEAHAVRGLGGAPAEGGRLRLQLRRALVEADRHGRRELAARLGEHGVVEVELTPTR